MRRTPKASADEQFDSEGAVTDADLSAELRRILAELVAETAPLERAA